MLTDTGTHFMQISIRSHANMRAGLLVQPYSSKAGPLSLVNALSANVTRACAPATCPGPCRRRGGSAPAHCLWSAAASAAPPVQEARSGTHTPLFVLAEGLWERVQGSGGQCQWRASSATAWRRLFYMRIVYGSLPAPWHNCTSSSIWSTALSKSSVIGL
jgi:hypothetical protein